MSGEELVKSEEELNGYRFEKVIGKDVDGRYVFRAVNYRREKISVKIIPVTPETLDLVFNEALFCCEINHPCITSSHQFMLRNQNKQLVLFMEYCQGNLGNDLKKIRDEDLGICAKNITDALYHIHEMLTITHCDLRPQSIQISPSNPKISFYGLEIPDEVFAESYLPPEYNGKHTKEGDMWALGLIMIQIFSKMRLNQIFPDLKGKKKPIHTIKKFSVNQALKYVKFTKMKGLIKGLLKQNPEDRPNINQFYVQLLGVVMSSDFCTNQKVATDYMQPTRVTPNNDKILRQEMRKVLLRQKEIEREKNEQIVRNAIAKSLQMEKAKNQIFRLDNVKDRTKLKILNFTDMKIVKIQQVYGIPNLEWLYLENNLIIKIQNLDYPNLKGLNLGNNKILRIENLQKMPSLEQLYLHNNLIERIENLEGLKNLKWLYFNDNKIKKLENLWGLPCLKTVALKSNHIDRFQAVNVSAVNKLKAMNVQVYLEDNN